MCILHLHWQQIPPRPLWAPWAPSNTQHTHILGQIAAVFTDHMENVHSGVSTTQPQSSLAVSHGPCAAPHPLFCLPEGKAQLPASQNGQSYVQEGGTNNQQLDFHSTESNTPRKWNLTVQNAWEHSVSKVLNMGGSLPPKNGLDTSRNYHRSPNSLLFFFFCFWPSLQQLANILALPKMHTRHQDCAQQVYSDWTLNAQEKGTD